MNVDKFDVKLKTLNNKQTAIQKIWLELGKPSHCSPLQCKEGNFEIHFY